MDRDAADRLIAAYLPKLYGFAVKRAFSYSEAEELCARRRGAAANTRL